MPFRLSLLQQATLYKFRYLVGYGFIIILLLFILGADIGSVPDGLSQAEMQQAVASTSMHISLNMDWVVNGIYNFIQKLSVEVFGLSRLSLILPSLIFGIATITLFSLTMRHWFRDSVAVVATVITMTSVMFITMMRSATPDIMLPFWSILLFYGAVRLLVERDGAFYWKLAIAIASLGLIYTPYGIYPLATVFISALFHPHVRSRLRHIKSMRLLVLIAIAIVGCVPIGIHLFLHPAEIIKLTGFDIVSTGVGTLRENGAQIYDMYLNFSKNGFSGTQIIPLFNLATVALALLGLLKSIRDKHMARSYVLLAWAGVTALTILVAPSLVVLTFLPVSLFVAIGIDTLVVDWYRLFPRNPYARVAGLVPLTILFLGIGSGNVSHYFDNYGHIANPSFSQSLPAIKKALTIEGDHPVTLVAPAANKAFYSILTKEYPQLTVTTEFPATTTIPTLVIPEAGRTYAATPSRIMTSDRATDGVILRTYRP